jgi:hypothetical protein
VSSDALSHRRRMLTHADVCSGPLPRDPFEQLVSSDAQVIYVLFFLLSPQASRRTSSREMLTYADIR